MLLSVMGTLVMSACAIDGERQDPDESSAVAAALSPGACTAVQVQEPVPEFIGAAGTPLTLSAIATCPAGSTPEYQFWVKPFGAPNWSILGPFVPGASSWTPPSPGSWSVTAVTRAIGAPESFQARANAVTGTVLPTDHAPIAVDDVLTTTENVTASVDVILNDSDSDGDALAVISNTSPSHGNVVFIGTIAIYTPSAGYQGPDSFTYTIDDDRGGRATATVAVSVTDLAPIAVDDVLTTNANKPGSTNVLTNDHDPDNDALAVTSFTQGAHGSVVIAFGVARYTPEPDYIGPDSFTYTIEDGHGLTATGTVVVTVKTNVPGCTISIAGPATGTFGELIHLTATADCNTAPPEVQWFRRVNSGFVRIQPFSTSLTLDFPADATGNITFLATVRTHGTVRAQGTSNTVTVRVLDNTPQCTSVTLVEPIDGQDLMVGTPATLTATAICPAGAVPELQFWVKPDGTSTWIILPDFTTDSGSWVPPAIGRWNVRAVARSVGSHVKFQVVSDSVTVNVLDCDPLH